MFSFIWVGPSLRPGAGERTISGSFYLFLAPWGMPLAMPGLFRYSGAWHADRVPVCVYEWRALWEKRA